MTREIAPLCARNDDHHPHRRLLSTVHLAGLRRHLRGRPGPGRCAGTAAACWTSATTGTGCPCQAAWPSSRRSGPAATIPTASAASGDSTNCCRSPRSTSASPSAKARRCCTPRTRVGRYVGMKPGRLFLQYEGMNPSGSFKDNGMSAAFTHARMRRRHAGRLRLDRQHQRLAGPVLLGHAADEGGDLRRLGQDRLRQALAGARLRRADRADRRRLRRRHGPRPGGLAASWASTWSTASTPSAWKARRRSCSACSRRCAGRCPTGSSCPAETWATPARSARRFTS